MAIASDGKQNDEKKFNRSNSQSNLMFTERSEGSERHPEKKRSMRPRAVTVTETQGLKDFQSLFLGHAGRISILQMSLLFVII